MTDFSHITGYIKSLYPGMAPVLLHCPQFLGNEKRYLAECIDTRYVSYVSHFVTDMEVRIKALTGAKYAVAMVSGTEALHMALIAAGVMAGDEVVSQPLTFAATSAAIVHCGAAPVYVDVDRDTMGMSPGSLRAFLEARTRQENGRCVDRDTGRIISACVPVHTFGHPCRIDEIQEVCGEHHVTLVEDAAESAGSFYRGRHTGTFGRAGILSFNGNKALTTGGGGMLITDDGGLAERARYLSTTAKEPARWGYYHREAGWNLRMPGLNAAIGVAQLEYFDRIIENKRETAALYQNFFAGCGIPCVTEPENSRANYWLNAVLLKDREEREAFLEYTNTNGVQTRPIWTLMYRMPPYEKCGRVATPNAEWLEDRLVNLPSGVRP